MSRSITVCGGYYVDLRTDLRLAIRYWNTGSFKPIMGKYEWVPDFLQLIAMANAQHTLTQQPVDMTYDCETVGLDEYRLPDLHHPGAFIVTQQFTVKKEMAHVKRFYSRPEETEHFQNPNWLEQMEFLFNCPWIRMKGANMKFDLRWLYVRSNQKIICSNFSFDTTMVGSLLNENRSNALDVHTKIYCPRLAGYSDEFDRNVDKDRMDLVPDEAMLPYAGGDTDACYEVAEQMKTQLLQDPALTSFYCNILHPASRAFEDLENGGAFIDREAFKELESELLTAHIQNVSEARKIMGGILWARHSDDSRPGSMNLTKKSMLVDFLFSPNGLNLKPKMFTAKPDKSGAKVPSTAMEHLLMFSDHPTAGPFIKIVEEDSSVMKTHDTYVSGFLQCLRPDGRFHPSYFLFVGNKDEGEGGAVTGRLSCHDPAMQVIPKHTKWAKPIRRCFVAPPGYVIMERDYSQGELRVVACISNCGNMILVYKQGGDLHVRTGARAAKITPEQLMALKKLDKEAYDAHRQKGKAGNAWY